MASLRWPASQDLSVDPCRQQKHCIAGSSLINATAEVIIIGAGPVGLTLAIDLAQRGVTVCVLEQGSQGDAGDAKCNTVSARTMEVFRRIGIADAVRAAGLPDDYPTDVVFSTAVSGREITRIGLPSRNERFAPDGLTSASGFPDSHWQTPEPVVRVSQYFLNPILYEYAKTFVEITLLPEVRFESYRCNAESIDVLAQKVGGGESVKVNGTYLIGCDGGRSSVRRQMGVKLSGDNEISRTRSSLVRCAEIRALYAGRAAWMNWVNNDRVSGVCVAIDGSELWLLHRSLRSSAVGFEDLDRDQSIRDLLGVGPDFTWQVLQSYDWTGRRLVADQFRQGNVFIEGDAAHLWVPMAGYGMNAGIADAMNLSWMLAAVIKGYAPPQILAAHEKERHPITEQVSRLAMAKALELSVRAATPESILQVNIPQFVCEGLNFGYYYENSPIIVYDDKVAPEYDMGTARPSTVPGCRLPHFWHSQGCSVYDLLGPYYSLLQFNGQKMDSTFEKAFSAAKMPLTVIETDAEAECFEHDFLLVRSDQHICWRGNGLPDLVELIVTVTGSCTSWGNRA